VQAMGAALYRVRLMEGFLAETRQDLSLARWRSCVDNSQLAVDNAAKALLALLAPVGRTHNPAILLRQALANGRYPSPTHDRWNELPSARSYWDPIFTCRAIMETKSAIGHHGSFSMKQMLAGLSPWRKRQQDWRSQSQPAAMARSRT